MFVSIKQRGEIKMRKNNLKNTIRKFVVGVALTCSLLTVLGSVSNDGIMPCGECIINEQTKN